MKLVEQVLLTLPEHQSSSPVFTRDRITRLMFMFCRSLFVLLSFGHCVVCPSSIYDSDYPFRTFKLILCKVGCMCAFGVWKTSTLTYSLSMKTHTHSYTCSTKISMQLRVTYLYIWAKTNSKVYITPYILI